MKETPSTSHVPKQPENGRFQATPNLPPQATLYHKLRIGSWKMSLLVNGVAICSLFIFGWIFLAVAFTTQPQFTIQVFVFLVSLPIFLLILLIVMILHELCHAIAFWLSTKKRPTFYFNLLAPSVGAPGWYFPRNHYILIGAAPFVLITAVGLIWLSQANILMLPKLVLALSVNAAGSVGDLLVVLWLLSQPADSYVFDEGEYISLYRTPL